MNGMLTVSFVTSTKMCQLLALQHTISFLTFYLHQSTQSILSPVDLYLIFEKVGKLEESSSTNWIFSLQKSIWKLISVDYTGSKNPV